MLKSFEYYFTLQSRRFNRSLEEAGIYPVVGYLIILLGFIGISELVFYKLESAPYLYPLIGFFLLIQIMDKKRVGLLESIFTKKDFYFIRIVENLAITFPFVIFILYQGFYLFAGGLILLSLIMAFLSFNSTFNLTIPTPFKKFPFEYVSGFRKYLLLFVIAFILLYKSIEAGNFNLGIFSMAFVFFICLSFYFSPEPKYYVWIFSSDGRGVLYKKIRHSLLCASIFVVPMGALLSITFVEKIWIVLAVIIIGYVFLSTIILAKYSAYPKEMSLPQAILFGLSLWFPPMLLFAIPIFYKKALKNLNLILK